MRNLLQETLEMVEACGFTVEDVDFVGLPDGSLRCDWADFAAMADKEYDPGYGSAEVFGDLVVLFKDGSYLERWEYDGSEGWRHITPVQKPEKYKPLTAVFYEDD